MQWYYAKHGKHEGPVELAVLRGKLQSGEVAPTDLVWMEGMVEWQPAGEVPDLTAAGAVPGGPAVPVPGAAAGAAPVAGHPPPGIVQPVYQQYVVRPPAAPTSGLAIASLVCGILSLMMCYLNGLAALPAVICGHAALKAIQNSPTPLGGRGLAIAGLITGYFALALQLMFIAFIAIGLAMENS